MKKTNKVNPNWSSYDKSVAECHLANYGVIYLDEYGCPIDDFDFIEDEMEETRC